MAYFLLIYDLAEDYLERRAALRAAIERYYKSFEAPPPPGNIFNIGVGTPMTVPAAR